MSWKTWVWVIPVLCILLGIGIWTGWTVMTASNEVDTVEDDSRSSVTKGASEFSGEVVNTPVSESIVVFQDGTVSYENGHDFIRDVHNFYNETLGWGRLESASYSEQRAKAETVIEIIDNIEEVKNEDLQKDFASIKDIAKKVTIKDDRDAMRKLHRYFHDLDIYFNGYDYHQTFQVTSFKGNI